MKFKYLGALLVLATVSFSFISDSSPLKIGEKIPLADVKLENISGRKATLSELKQTNGLLVVFSCNTCPFVLAWENRYNELNDLATKNKIGMVLVNSNEAKRNGDDSKEMMISHAKELGYTMPYLIDTDHKVADAFGARTTPHVFLFNKEGKLAYTGAIDDNSKDASAVKDSYLKDALSELGAGKTSCKTAETKAIGCSIKRVAVK